MGYNPSELFSSIHRGSYTSAHVLLNLLNELSKRDKMQGLPSILALFRNNVRFYLSYDIKINSILKCTYQWQLGSPEYVSFHGFAGDLCA